MSVNIHKGQSLDSINMTPIIDMVFLLLIFFLVASQFAEEERELEVMLPTASEAQPLTQRPKELFVNIDKNGVFFVENRTMAADELEAVLRQAVVDNPTSQTVVIRADKRVPLDAVVTVMNLCKKVGVRDYPLTTDGEGK